MEDTNGYTQDQKLNVIKKLIYLAFFCVLIGFFSSLFLMALMYLIPYSDSVLYLNFINSDKLDMIVSFLCILTTILGIGLTHFLRNKLKKKK